MSCRRYPTLKDYQVGAVEKLTSNGGTGGLLMEVGLGKTLTTIEAIRRMDDPFPCLVVAPKAVALNTWPNEVKKWGTASEITGMRVAVGSSKAAVTKTLMTKSADAATFIIINYERLPLLVELGLIGRFRTLVVDESTKIKNSQAKRTKLLCKYVDLFKQRIILTGTPTPNGDLTEMWSQMYLLDKGQRLGKNLTAFRNKYCELKMDYYGGGCVRRHEVKPDMVDAIWHRISELCVSVRAKDYLKVDSSVVRHNIEMTDKQGRQYTVLKEAAILALQEAEDVSFETGVIINRLMQFTSGAVYITDDEGVRTTQYLNTNKIEYIQELVETIGKNVIVAYNFQFEAEIIKEAFPNAVVLAADSDINAVVDEWNAGRTKVLALHPGRGGHGLNLQQGGHHIIWFSLPWSYEHYAQTNGRLHRTGQENPVIIHHLITKGTADGYVENKVAGKGKCNDELLDYLKWS